MPTISERNLHDVVRRILDAAGASAENASRMADALVKSNVRGVDTHGVFHLAGYVKAVQDGKLDATASPSIVRETPNTALVDGNRTFGHVAAKFATDVAVRKAKENDVAVVGLVRSEHIGRLGEYAEIAADEGVVAIVCGAGYSLLGSKVAAPYGGSKGLLSSNPIAIGFPGGEEPAMVFDYATTAMANSKMNLYKMRNEELPANTVIDKDGYPTTNPLAVQEGGFLLPFGGHKGFALMMAVEFLGQVLVGSDTVEDDGMGTPAMIRQGVSIIAIRAGVFRPDADFKRRSDEILREVRSVPPAPGFKQVMAPGDPENRAQALRSAEGIPIPDQVWQSIVEAGESVGVVVSISKDVGRTPVTKTEQCLQMLMRKLSDAESSGASYIDVRAGDFHQEVWGLGSHSGSKNRMPIVSRAMGKLKLDKDEYLYRPPSGMGANLQIRYLLPR